MREGPSKAGLAPSYPDPSLLNRERLERLTYLDAHPGSDQASRDGHLVVAEDSDALAIVGRVRRDTYDVNTHVRYERRTEIVGFHFSTHGL